MGNFVIDWEADGPVPGHYSGVCFGAVSIEDPSKSFYGKVAPISNRWDPEALAISGFTREEHMGFPHAKYTIPAFLDWLKQFGTGNHTLWSDNNQFDGAYTAYYTVVFGGRNPFGYSSRRIGDLACGAERDIRYRWKHLRDSPHTHNPVDDARGNAEALRKIVESNGIRGLKW